MTTQTTRQEIKFSRGTRGLLAVYGCFISVIIITLATIIFRIVDDPSSLLDMKALFAFMMFMVVFGSTFAMLFFVPTAYLISGWLFNKRPVDKWHVMSVAILTPIVVSLVLYLITRNVGDWLYFSGALVLSAIPSGQLLWMSSPKVTHEAGAFVGQEINYNRSPRELLAAYGSFIAVLVTTIIFIAINLVSVGEHKNLYSLAWMIVIFGVPIALLFVAPIAVLISECLFNRRVFDKWHIICVAILTSIILSLVMYLLEIAEIWKTFSVAVLLSGYPSGQILWMLSPKVMRDADMSAGPKD